MSDNDQLSWADALDDDDYAGMAELPLRYLDKIILSVGKHDSREQGVCAMELVAWLAGEEHSDSPQCACPTIRSYVVRINDSGPQWLRDELKARALKIVGTRGSVELQKRRVMIFAKSAIAQAERVLPIFEAARPNDDRPRKAIKAAKAALENPTADAAARAADAARAAYAAYAADVADVADAAARAADVAYAAYVAYVADAADVADVARAVARAAARAADAAYAADVADVARAADTADVADAADVADVAYADKDQSWRDALAALDEALAITEAA